MLKIHQFLKFRHFHVPTENWKLFFNWLSSFRENGAQVYLQNFQKIFLPLTLSSSLEPPEWPKFLKFGESSYFYASFKMRQLWIKSENFFKKRADCRKIFRIDQCGIQEPEFVVVFWNDMQEAIAKNAKKIYFNIDATGSIVSNPIQNEAKSYEMPMAKHKPIFFLLCFIQVWQKSKICKCSSNY